MASATARAAPAAGQSAQPPPSSSSSPAPALPANRQSKSATNGVTSTIPTHSIQSNESRTVHQHVNDRLLFLVANFIGCTANVTLVSGERFTGIFSTPSFDTPDIRYAFKMTKRLSTAQANGNHDSHYVGLGEDHLLLFDARDVAELSVDNVSLDKVQVKAANGSAGFRTDTDISAHASRLGSERELQKWEPAANEGSVSFSSSSNKAWDQFEANERLYGVKSDYKEDMYTTSINKTDPGYKARALEADRIAREIEGQVSSNIHVAEERGQVSQGSQDVGEEERYSGVVRPAPSSQTGNRYVPPSMRAPTSQPTVQGAPFDPAIIHSQLKSPDSHAATKGKPSAPGAVAAVDSTAKENAPPPSQADLSAANDKATHTKGTGTASNGLDATPQKAPSAVSKSRSPANAAPENITQNVEKEVLRSFKAFSADERLKMQERQRAQARKEKDVKLNDLKKFAMNFKLRTDVPHDMLGILAKDKTKQQEIAEKAKRQAQEASVEKPKMTSGDATLQTSDLRSDAAGASATSAGPRGPRSAQASKPPLAFPAQKGPQARPPSGNLGQRLLANQRDTQPAAATAASASKPVPTGPAAGVNDREGSQTPSSTMSSRFNVRAMEFRPNPTASSFSPGSQPRVPASPAAPNRQVPPARPQRSSFFGDNKRSSGPKKSIRDGFNPIRRMKAEAEKENKSKDYTSNGGIPNAFRTAPTWDVQEGNQEKSYRDMFERSMPQPAMPTANGPMPHHHQLPPHLQPGAPQMPIPPQGPHQQFPQFGQPNGDHRFDDHRMHMSNSTSSVYPSPRFQQNIMMQPSPMMGHAQPAGYGGQGMQQIVMGPNGQPIQFVPGRPGGQQFISPQGQPIGVPMMPSHSQGGQFMSMPMHQPGMQVYAPPQQGHMFPGGPQAPSGPGGYPSPRGAPMMVQQGSQQGHMQPYIMMPHQGGQGVFPQQNAQQMHFRPGMPMQHSPSYGSPHMGQHFAQQQRGPGYGGQQFPQQQPQQPMAQAPPMSQPQVSNQAHGAAGASEEVK